MNRHTPALLGLCLLFACGGSGDPEPTAVTQPEEEGLAAKYLPTNDQTLMIIGQDLYSIRNYTKTELFPAPGGVTIYTNLYLNRDEEKVWAGLGLDNNLEPDDREASWWQSGPHNSYKASLENTDAALVIGLDITEKYAENGLARIANGEFDAEIDKIAALIKQVGKPVYLRIGYEFDGTWNQGYANTDNYKNAWIYIVNRLRAQEANNMATVWQASTSPADDAIEGRFEEDLSVWYPGDAYVDWIGYSWFLTPDHTGTNPAATATQKQLTDQLLDFARARKKPVMCAEAAPQGYFIERKTNANIGGVIDGPSGENVVSVTPQEIWDQWYAPFLQYIDENKDIIRALAYINCYWDEQPKCGPPYNEGLWGDTRVEADPEITRLWQEELAKPIYLHGGPDTFERLQNH